MKNAGVLLGYRVDWAIVGKKKSELWVWLSSFVHPVSSLFAGFSIGQLFVHEVGFSKCFKVMASSQEVLGMVSWYTVNPMRVSLTKSQKSCM